MDSVWLVTYDIWYETSRVLGVFKTKDAAMRCAIGNMGSEFLEYKRTESEHSYYQRITYSIQGYTYAIEEYGVNE